MMRRVWAICLVMAVLTGFYVNSAMGAEPSAPAKNVILFIGDGMGPAHITAARLVKVGATGKLAMESMPVSGASRTFSTSSFITDSAAGATALACGVKTYNGALGVTDAKADPAGESRPLQNLSQLAQTNGKAAGVVTTTMVTHATPAGYYAHIDSRGSYQKIADQITSSGLTLLMGGGRDYLYPSDWKDPESGAAGQRDDGRNISQELEAKGWTIVHDQAQFDALDPASPAPVLAAFEYSHMNYELDRPKDVAGEPSLAQMVDFAIRKLSQDPDGFFLMVEGGRIDHASHANQAQYAVADTIALDQAIEAALKATSAQDTLIVVTADHETGGLAINFGGPLSAGPDEVFGNTSTDPEKGMSILSWGSGPGGNSPNWTDAQKADAVQRAAHHLDGGGSHGGVDVPVLASGPGAMAFTGYQYNSEIAWKLGMAMALGGFSDPVNAENRTACLQVHDESKDKDSVQAETKWPLYNKK